MRYFQRSFTEARDEGFPAPDWFGDDGWDYLDNPYRDELNYASGIWYVEDDGTMSFISCDGGEPEDQTLSRDYDWVVDELNKAYESGFQYGYRKGLSNSE